MMKDIISNICTQVKGLFQKSRTNELGRTESAVLNIIYMIVLKGGSILAGLLIIPITLNFVNSETYGIWLTLSSIVAWISFFDIGINNGLKNRLAEALANNDLILGRKYVSTTYAGLCLVFIPLMIFLWFASAWIDWCQLLKITSLGNDELVSAVRVIIVYFCVNFVTSTINVVAFADQKPAITSLISFVQQVLTLIIVWVLTKVTDGNLLKLCFGLCVSPLVVSILANVIYYSKRYKAISPRINCVDFNVIPDLLKLGVLFFIIQIAGVIQIQMVNFLIIREFGANDVTSYNIAFRYYSILTMLWGIAITPLWSSVTDAITKNDWQWVKITLARYLKLLILFVFLGIIMLIIAPVAYNIWVGDSVSISFSVTFWLFVSTIVMMYANLYVYILNGAAILKLQTIACVLSPIVFLSVYFGLVHLGLGVESIIIASIVANYNGLIIAPIQVRNLMISKFK